VLSLLGHPTAEIAEQLGITPSSVRVYCSQAQLKMRRWLDHPCPRRGPAAAARARRRSSLLDVAWIAGTRWRIEECFQQAKNEAGMDHYQVRSWRAWYAHITLAMLALAYLAATRAREHQHDHEQAHEQALSGEKGEPPPAANG
jgi:hypothetical protein